MLVAVFECSIVDGRRGDFRADVDTQVTGISNDQCEFVGISRFRIRHQSVQRCRMRCRKLHLVCQLCESAQQAGAIVCDHVSIVAAIFIQA